MKKVLLALFFVLICLPFGTMMGGENVLYWDSVKQITWKDYQKDVPKTTKHKLHSGIGILILPEQKDDFNMTANVYAAFNRDNSAKPEKDGQTDDVLHHEQSRFDLAEVYARMERKQLPDSTYKTVSRFYSIAKKINTQANKDFTEESAKYDSITKMGSNATAQAKWDKDIQDRLTKYADFTFDNKVNIPIEKKIIPQK